jgi:hypothetical protein
MPIVGGNASPIFGIAVSITATTHAGSEGERAARVQDANMPWVSSPSIHPLAFARRVAPVE